MSESIKFILFCLFFVWGINYTENGRTQTSDTAKLKSVATFSNSTTSNQETSFKITASDINHSQQPICGDSGKYSEYEVYNAILTSNNLLNNANGEKILGKNSCIRTMKMVSPYYIQANKRMANSEVYTHQHSCRYYVYTLRHIIV